MFRSAALKLTGAYLLIIMLLSVSMSIAMYRISSTDIERIAEGQFSFLRSLLGPIDVNNFLHVRQLSLDEDRQKLRNNLVLFNSGVLVIGGLASYFLARRTLRPIEAALDAQSRFAADASHELRTPLAVMQSENEVALRNPKLSRQEAVALLSSNLEEVGKLKDLSEGLLTLARTGSESSDKAVVPVQKVFDGAILRAKKHAAAKKIKIEQKHVKLAILGNLGQLTQLLAILLDNAIKYSPDGSKVSLSAKKDGDFVLLQVKDRGRGIAQEDLPRIFDRFYRSDTSRSKSGSGGFGLGLAIAKKIVDSNGGEISAKSQLGRGSTFSVRLPQI